MRLTKTHWNSMIHIETWWVLVSLGRARWVLLSLVESCWVMMSLGESWWVLLSLAESLNESKWISQWVPSYLIYDSNISKVYLHLILWDFYHIFDISWNVNFKCTWLNEVFPFSLTEKSKLRIFNSLILIIFKGYRLL